MGKIFTLFDRHLFAEGKHCQLYNYFGAHLQKQAGIAGANFAVWAPHAREIVVIGDFNSWQADQFYMENTGDGIWQLFIPGVKAGDCYKYFITGANGQLFLKADPFAFAAELRPKTASVVVQANGMKWTDAAWGKKRVGKSQEKPLCIYELHLGSWKTGEDGRFLSYLELAEVLPAYVKDMGFTHVELMPLAEHPLDMSWGYQITGYYAPTSRYGSPDDLKYFINSCHKVGIGVIMDWVPGHFCKDDHGLRRFDGSWCYEPSHSLRRNNEGWGTSYFDFSKPEVRSFLVSNACYWLEEFHIDGLRVDAVASMIYHDYTKESGQWLPNEHGGRENLAAIGFLKDLNVLVFGRNPDVLMMAEESTAYPLVTGPVHDGGLGFNYKWNMGWMNDVLEYMEQPTVHRKWHHNKITFSLMYAFSENFVLPFSHDEVVHGKKSLLDKMPGDYWQKFANLRLLLGYMMAHPGKKLLFMGQEFGQFIEWDEKRALDWFLLGYTMHGLLHGYVKKLNQFYLQEACLWEVDCDWSGFRWLDADDSAHSIITFLRFDGKGRHMVVLCNFSEVINEGYRVGVPNVGAYYEAFNSDATEFGGSGASSRQILIANPTPWNGYENSLVVRIPPLAVLYLLPGYKKEGKRR